MPEVERAVVVRWRRREGGERRPVVQGDGRVHGSRSDVAPRAWWETNEWLF